MMDEAITLEEVYRDYADALGRDVRTLMDVEKQQASLNALLSLAHVAPFVEWCDQGDAILGALAPDVETLNQWVQKHKGV